MTERDEDLPASKIVERYGEDIKAAIAEIAEATPTIAKTAATDEARRRAVWLLAVTWVSAVVAAAGVSYLMLTHWPRSHAIDVTYHRTGDTEVCVRDAGSPVDHPLFLCHPLR